MPRRRCFLLFFFAHLGLMDKNGVIYGMTQTFEPGAPFYGTVFALATN